MLAVNGVVNGVVNGAKKAVLGGQPLMSMASSRVSERSVTTTFDLVWAVPVIIRYGGVAVRFKQLSLSRCKETSSTPSGPSNLLDLQSGG